MPPSTLPRAAVHHQAKDTLWKPCDKKNEYAGQKHKYAGKKKEFHEPSHKKKSRCAALLLFFQSHFSPPFLIKL